MPTIMDLASEGSVQNLTVQGGSPIPFASRYKSFNVVSSVYTSSSTGYATVLYIKGSGYLLEAFNITFNSIIGYVRITVDGVVLIWCGTSNATGLFMDENWTAVTGSSGQLYLARATSNSPMTMIMSDSLRAIPTTAQTAYTNAPGYISTFPIFFNSSLKVEVFASGAYDYYLVRGGYK